MFGSLTYTDIKKPQIDLIELGQQYLKYFGYKLTLGDDTINSQTSPIATNSQQVNYAYNLPTCNDLRTHLNKNKRFLKQLNHEKWQSQNVVYPPRTPINSS